MRFQIFGIEPTNLAGVNTTNEGHDIAKQNFMGPFQPVDTIQGVEVSWTLGKMILYAAGQIMPDKHSLPVGFGSNVAPGIPSDFENAGSAPLSTTFDAVDDDSDSDSITFFTGHALSSILGVIIFAIIVLYFCHKPDRLRRILRAVPWRCRHPKRKSKPWLGLTRKVFGRWTAHYDRILEEGDADEYELDAAFDLVDGSDGGDGHGNGGPKVNVERGDDVNPPSVMDRHGLVLRTESRERLTTHLQMLNAGKRSRAGSPTRSKGPPMTPWQDSLRTT